MKTHFRWSRRSKFITLGLIVISTLVALSIYFSRKASTHESGNNKSLSVVAVDITKGTALMHDDELVSVVGTIEAGETVSVSAPFDGVIKEKRIAFDTDVVQGQALLVLDQKELEQKIQEAKVSMLKAGAIKDELADWDNSSEVARSKRLMLQARQQVEQAERKVKDSEPLMSKGIIPRTEYDSLAEQLLASKGQLEAADSDLQSTLKKAGAVNLEVSRLEYFQAKDRFSELSKGLALSVIVAPRSGIITKPPASSGQAPLALDVGSRVNKGQLLFNVSLTNRLRIAAQVDETDVTKLAVGMPVAIWSESQGQSRLKGRVAEVAARANQSGNSSRNAVFDIKVDFPDLSFDQRRLFRVGMSCNVSIGVRERLPER